MLDLSDLDQAELPLYYPHVHTVAVTYGIVFPREDTEMMCVAMYTGTAKKP